MKSVNLRNSGLLAPSEAPECLKLYFCSHTRLRDVVLQLMDKFTFQWFSLDRRWLRLQTWQIWIQNYYFFHVPESNKTSTQVTHPTLNVSFLCLYESLFEYPGTVQWSNWFHIVIWANFLTWYPVDRGSYCGHYFAFTSISLPTRPKLRIVLPNLISWMEYDLRFPFRYPGSAEVWIGMTQGEQFHLLLVKREWNRDQRFSQLC